LAVIALDVHEEPLILAGAQIDELEGLAGVVPRCVGHPATVRAGDGPEGSLVLVGADVHATGLTIKLTDLERPYLARRAAAVFALPVGATPT
jgi:hypothetical protein